MSKERMSNSGSPSKLSPTSEAWVRKLAARHGLSSTSPGMMLLTEAGFARDRADQARAAIEVDGFMLPGRYKDMPRPHPAVNVERDCRNSITRILQVLSLDPELDALEDE